MNYGEILKRAWETIWKHKILWVFGLLASCTANSGGGGGSNANFSSSNGDFTNNNPFSFNFEREFGHNQFFHNFNFPTDGWVIALIILGILLLILILSLVFTALGSVGQIGLSKGSWLVDEGEPKLTFGGLWQSAKKPFWRVFLMHILLGLAGFLLAILIIVGVLLVTIPTMGIGLVCLLPFLCIFGLLMFVIGILLNIMIQLMIPMMVNEDVALWDSVKKSYELLKQNFWNLVLMGIILWVMGLVIGLIIAIPMIMLVFGFVGVGALTATLGNLDSSVIVPLILAFTCIILPISMFINAVLQSYLGSAWTLTYRRITGRQFGQESVQIEPIIEA